MKEFFLTLVSIFSSLLFLFLSVGFGWFIVWKLFLSRFKFVRELLCGMNENTSVTEGNNSKGRTKKLRRE